MSNLVAANDYADIPVSGQGAVGIQLSGTWAGTVSFQASVDGTNYLPMNLLPVNSGTASTTTTTSNIFLANVSGLSVVRVKLTTTSSGTVVVSWRVSSQSGRY
jgi:hypothetical protein